MRLSRVLGKTRKETLQVLEDDEEFIWQLAFNAIEPIPNLHEMWATLFESQVMGQKFNHQRWMPGYVKQQSGKQIRSAMSALRGSHSK